MADRRELNGWGQIADYLDVSVRTAQIYERDLNLPVRRLPGPKGRVWAAVEELDAWKLGRGRSNSQQDQPSSSGGTALPAPALVSLKPKRLGFLSWPFL